MVFWPTKNETWITTALVFGFAILAGTFFWLLDLFLPALLYMGVIFYLSSHPAPLAVQEWPVWWEIKSIHLAEYALLTALDAEGVSRLAQLIETGTFTRWGRCCTAC